MWLLVEFFGENEVFSSYSVVNIDQLVTKDDDLYVGKSVFVRIEETLAQQAHVIRASDNKHSLVELKSLLERKERHVVSLCRNAIADLKSGSVGRNQQEYQKFSVKTPEYMDTSAQPSSTSAVLRHNDVFDSDSSYSSIENPSQIVRSFNNVGLRDCILAGNINSNTFISSTPLPGMQSTNNESESNMETCSRTAFIQKTMEILYNEVAKVLAYAKIDGALVKDLLEVVGLNPIEGGDAPESYIEDALSSSGSDNNEVQPAVVKSEKQTNELESGEIGDSTCENNNDQHLEMISIGSGHAKIPTKQWTQIDWSSYTRATRSLLLAVFPRAVLATHSLTGKQSPIFPNKPPKQALDQNIINDIIETVAARCNVSKRHVRTIIGIKCADETKLYKKRMEKLKKRRTMKNQKNNLPLNTSTDS